MTETASLPDHETKLCIECDKPDPRTAVPIQGMETIIAEALKEFGQCTFHNYWEYLLVLLEMSVPPEKYSDISDFSGKVTAILKDWAEIHGDKATVAYLTCRLRKHRTIVNKIRRETLLALGYNDNIPLTP